VDGKLGDEILDASREKNLLDAEGKTESSRAAEFIRRALNCTEVEVEAKSLASDALPGLVVLNEEERRFRDYMTLTQGKPMPNLLSKKTFIINTNNKLIQTILRLQNKQPEIASDLARHLYDLSLLSMKELDAAETERVLSKQTTLLEKLAILLP
jgi:molecular chaperone HtpG